MKGQFDVLLPGQVAAPVLKMDAPISFWGGVDQLTGRIIDTTHPQAGKSVSGVVLLVPMIRGSGGTPGNLATLIKIGRAPATTVLGVPCMNVLTGAIIGQTLYDTVCPLFVSGADVAASIPDARRMQIERD